ncbi:MAG TPA: hypothetical protein VGN98_17815 [Tianweitania sediminis]|jgi:DNA-binding GntR family transcriptional regulator|nr:hypothetical protein [Tianweitania sediminis]
MDREPVLDPISVREALRAGSRRAHHDASRALRRLYTVQLPGRGSLARSMQFFVRSHSIRLKAIEARDAKGAAARMEKHVSAYADVMRTKLMTKIAAA